MKKFALAVAIASLTVVTSAIERLQRSTEATIIEDLQVSPTQINMLEDGSIELAFSGILKEGGLGGIVVG